MTRDKSDQHGILFPAALPTFERRDVPGELSGFIRWYWITRWSMPDGAVSRQDILPFPAANLVVQRTGVTLSGAATAVDSRELTGDGWAFGVLLRPAGLAQLAVEAASIVDSEVLYVAEDLKISVRQSMDAGDVTRAAEAMTRWWIGKIDEVIEPDLTLADRLLALAEDDPAVIDVPGLAAGLGMSTRSVQRLAKQRIGLTPLQIIRRYRLQDAALRLRNNPDLTAASVAAELGYADQAHLAADFRTTLGLSPRDYRAQRQP